MSEIISGTLYGGDKQISPITDVSTVYSNGTPLSSILEGQTIYPFIYAKDGTVHKLTGNADATYFEFTTNASFDASSETWTLNGSPITVKYANGQTLMTGAFTSGVSIVGKLGNNDNQISATFLNLAGGGQISADNIEGLGEASKLNVGTSAGNIPVLDENGKIDASVIPNTVDYPLSIDKGGTGADNATAALNALGAASATHNHSAAEINTGTLPVARGGTGSTDAATARTNLGITVANIGAVPSTRKIAGKALSADVTLAKADVGLGNVDNTADSAKTVKTAGSCTGNATTATKLATARTIGISGGATGTATSFNGSANITIPVTALDVSKAKAGTLPVSRGGTGNTKGNASACNGLTLAVASSAPTAVTNNRVTFVYS